MAESASWPSPATDSPYSRILHQIDEEARGRNKEKEESTESDGSTSSSDSTSSDQDSESEEVNEVAPCPEHECADISHHDFIQIHKRQARIRGGASPKDVSDTGSIRSKASTTKRRPQPPGLLEALFLPRTTRAATTRRRSTTDVKGKNISITESPVAPAIIKTNGARLAAVRRRSTTDVKGKTPSIAELTKAPSITSQKTTLSSPKKQQLKPPVRSVSLFGALGSPSQPAPTVKIECITCLSDDIPIRRSAKLECKHRMCHSCLKRVFQLSTTDPQLMPPRCCTDQEIPLVHVEKLFDVKFKVLWNRKFAEYATKNRLYCPKKGCGIWIKPKYIKKDSTTGREMGKCKECKTEVCKKCNMRWHGRRECENDEGTKRVLELGKEQGWKRCYNCREMVQLAEGCNHMKCRCNAEFCMVCAKKWKTCDCPWFNLPPDMNIDNFRMPFGFDLPPPPPPFGFPRNRNNNNNNLPLPPPPPPPPAPEPAFPPAFRDRRDDPFNPLEAPAMFRPPPPAPPPMRRPRPSRRARPIPANNIDSRDAQEAADEALARQMQDEEELDTGVPVLHNSSLADEDDDGGLRERRARRARRRIHVVNEDDENWPVEERKDREELQIDSAEEDATRAGLDVTHHGGNRRESWMRYAQ